MSDPYYTGTEWLEMSTGGLLEERKALKHVGFMGSPNTFSKLQLTRTAPNIYSAYRLLFNAVPSRIAKGEGGYEQYSYVERAINNVQEMLNLVEYLSPNKTLSMYPTSDLQALEQRYIFRNRSEVINFTVNNSFLLQSLHEACEQIRNFFGKSTQVVLEVVTDPEFAEDQELVIFIRTYLSPDEAFEKLEQFDDEWWLDVPATVRKKLCIDVEFI